MYLAAAWPNEDCSICKAFIHPPDRDCQEWNVIISLIKLQMEEGLLKKENAVTIKIMSSKDISKGNEQRL